MVSDYPLTAAGPKSSSGRLSDVRNAKRARRLTAGLALLALSLWLVHSPPEARAAVGVNKLNSTVRSNIDAIVDGYLGKTPNKATKLTLGVVFAGQIVYSRSYAAAGFKADSLTVTHQWASISKTLTALIVFRMLERRQLSLNTPIWDYDPSYLNKVPSQYQDPPLTLKHLLTHTGGVNHLGPLSWTHPPAEVFLYSSNGYGIIGTDVLPAIAVPDTYPTLVENEIATRIGAASLGVAQPTTFSAPGAYVSSNITDLAKYAIAIMDDELVTPETLYEQVLQRHVYVFDPPTGKYIDRGLGFKLESLGDNLLAVHHGDNGKPEAMLFVRPRKKLAVCVFSDATSSAEADDVDTQSLAEAVESQLTSVSNPCAVPDDGAVLTASPGTLPLINPTQVTLSWIPFGSSYTVQRGTAAGGPYSIVATLTGTTYTDTGLASGSAYYYRVSDGVTNTNEERVVLPLFKDDFENGNGTGWTQNGGNWTIGTDLTRYFHQNNKSGQYTAVASSAGPWANYSVQANIKVFGFGSSSGWTGLLARYTDAGNYYYVRLHCNNTLEVRKKASGVDSLLAGKAFIVTAGATTPDVGPVYLVKLEANGSTVKCYVDGRLELTAIDASHSSGRVGVITNDADALFDEMLVKQAPLSLKIDG
jgi:CubicO group peptidase (beta-lactamase class C family)